MRGHLRQRGTRTYELRAFVGRDPLTRRDRYKTRTFKGSKREAEQALAKFVLEMSQGVVSSDSFGALVGHWFEVASTTRDWSPTTVKETKRIIDTKLGPLMAISLEKIRTPLLDTFYARLRTHGGECGHDPRQNHGLELCARGRPLSAASVRRIHGVIHSALEQAVAWDLLMFNPASRASPGRVDSTEITLPEVEEVLALFTAAEAENPDLAVFLVLAAVTGARRGELCALRWSDFPFGNASVTIARGITIGPEGPVERRKPKTRSSVRTIAIDAGTIALLEAHRARCSERALACGVPLPKNAFLFSSEPDGCRPWRPDSTSRRFRLLREACGLNEDIHLHSLRHFVVTKLLISSVAMDASFGMLRDHTAAWGLGFSSVACVG